MAAAIERPARRVRMILLSRSVLMGHRTRSGHPPARALACLVPPKPAANWPTLLTTAVGSYSSCGAGGGVGVLVGCAGGGVLVGCAAAGSPTPSACGRRRDRRRGDRHRRRLRETHPALMRLGLAVRLLARRDRANARDRVDALLHAVGRAAADRQTAYHRGRDRPRTYAGQWRRIDRPRVARAACSRRCDTASVTCRRTPPGRDEAEPESNSLPAWIARSSRCEWASAAAGIGSSPATCSRHRSKRSYIAPHRPQVAR